MAKVLILGAYEPDLVNFRGDLMKQMVYYGHEVFASVPRASNSTLQKLKKIGVNYKDIDIERTKISPIRDLLTLRKIEHLIESVRPEIMLSYSIKPVIFGSIAASRVGVDHIFALIEGLGYVFADSSIKSRFLGMISITLYKRSLSLCDKVFLLNKDDKSLFINKNIIEEEKTILINGIGVDLNFYYPATFPKNITFLLAARLIKDKGIREYVKAARILKNKYPNVRFLMAGSIDENPNAIRKNELSEWFKSGAIEYKGFVPDIRTIMVDASIYVLPSYYREGIPRSIMEAMSMGRPIITTHSTGCKETVEQCVNGLKVPVKDVDALVEAMEYYIKFPKQITNMGKESRRIAENRFNVKTINEIILNKMGLAP